MISIRILNRFIGNNSFVLSILTIHKWARGHFRGGGFRSVE